MKYAKKGPDPQSLKCDVGIRFATQAYLLSNVITPIIEVLKKECCPEHHTSQARSHTYVVILL